MYAPTKKDVVFDLVAYWGSLVVLGVIVVLGCVAQVTLPVWLYVAAGILYLLVGFRFSLRFVYIRSHLGPLNHRDLWWSKFWVLSWPAMPAIILYDMHPIMHGEAERSLCKTKKGVTAALEQSAASSRWQLGDQSGHVRRPGENYR